MYGNRINTNEEMIVPSKKNCCFSLTNVALDPESLHAYLFTRINGKQILISELNRKSGSTSSVNFSLQFQSEKPVCLIAKNGSIHILGIYKPISRKNSNKRIQEQCESSQMEQEKPEKDSVQEKSQIIMPLRRSTRQRRAPPPSNNDNKKRKDHTLSNMAKHFDLSDKDLEDELDQKEDEEIAYDKKQLQGEDSSSSSSSSEKNDEDNNKKQNIGQGAALPSGEIIQSLVTEDEVRKRRKLVEQTEEKYVFSKPTKNPYL